VDERADLNPDDLNQNAPHISVRGVMVLWSENAST